MKIESVLVTGANRGIGFEFVKQFSELEDPPAFVFATYRNESTVEDLKKLQEKSAKSRVILIKLDTTVQQEIEEARITVEQTLRGRGLNLLVNNAGRGLSGRFPNITQDQLLLLFKTNTVGPIMMLQAFYPLLEKAASNSKATEMSTSRACVLNISSVNGSIQKTGVDLMYWYIPEYKISKAALNMGMRIIAANVRDKGILVVNVCPGWVKTDLGGKDKGHITPEECIGDMLKLLPTLNKTQHGSFMDRMGNRYEF
ncbi:hypothetical protein JTE90_024261 [Oedothorax gibbosus]|uniref:C-factor n=1 Tax=Oedothorax gibbosus TaxID=931172 RepID=A0AAV6VM42_9ARAC|nr:hypothetical protein JTE90_024261 [Oedothorax gibbosus]